MKFLANENIPGDSVHLLRKMGYDVAGIAEERPGAKDIDILKRSAKEKRVILTFDRDYGELIFKYPRFIPAGVVYFRFEPETPEQPADILIILSSREMLS